MEIRIYDIKGTEIQKLFSGSMPEGSYHVVFDADGRLPSGSYYYLLSVNGSTATKRIDVIH